MFAQPEQPIREILVALGGPRGIDDAVLSVLEKVGLHLGLMKVKLPGGLQHSCVALGDLLAFHDRGYLHPIMEDYRFLKKESYQKWRAHMSKALTSWALTSSAEEKTQALRRFVRVFQSQQELSTTEPELSASLTGDAVGAAPVTPRQVDSFVQELQAQGVLPSGKRPWRLQFSLQKIEPERALVILQSHRRRRWRALREGLDFDPWWELCLALDEAITATHPAPEATPEGVRQLLGKLREAHGLQGAPEPLEVRSLEDLTCKEACALLQRLQRRGLTNSGSRSAGVAMEAAIWAVKCQPNSGYAHLHLQGLAYRKRAPPKRTREMYEQLSCKRWRKKWTEQSHDAPKWSSDQPAEHATKKAWSSSEHAGEKWSSSEHGAHEGEKWSSSEHGADAGETWSSSEHGGGGGWTSRSWRYEQTGAWNSKKQDWWPEDAGKQRPNEPALPPPRASSMGRSVTTRLPTTPKLMPVPPKGPPPAHLNPAQVAHATHHTAPSLPKPPSPEPVRKRACIWFMESVLLHGENAQSDEDDGDSE
ncbi:unnamed protein product [Durusdinium trenchii]